jgi:hypothetical protein
MPAQHWFRAAFPGEAAPQNYPAVRLEIRSRASGSLAFTFDAVSVPVLFAGDL